jgi:hypothetical protein
MPKVAIAAYADNSDDNRFVREANLMVYSGRGLSKDFTFVLYVHPEAINKIVPRDNLILIPCELPDIQFLKDYPYAKSLAFLDERVLDYDYVIKTDTDVFFTDKLNSFVFDSKIYCGPGHYMHSKDMKILLQRYATKFGYPKYKHKQSMHSTLFGPAKDILNIMKKSYTLNEKLFYSMPSGEWGKTLYRFVSSMYATEIVLYDYDVVITSGIDSGSDFQEPKDSVMHIHCFHSDKNYSKFEERRGKYLSIKKNRDDGLIDSYCLNIYIDLRNRKELVYSKALRLR